LLITVGFKLRDHTVWLANGPADFLPHNGYATVQQYIDATTKVVGMGPILSLFLSAYGGAIDGDVTAWSMGGTPSLAQGGVTGILGNGLIGSHNKYEGDASPTRPDLYQDGNNWKTVSKQFQELVDYSPGGQVTLDSLTAFRSHRVDTQVANNPYYFYGPFAGVLVQPAAYTFIFRFMANHSAESPAGTLNYDVLQSWFGVQGSNHDYSAVQGSERIPDNWVRSLVILSCSCTFQDLANSPSSIGEPSNIRTKRPTSLLTFSPPLLYIPNSLALEGELCSLSSLLCLTERICSNTGKTNTFTPVDIANLTGGVFNAGTLTQGNNFACFFYQLAAQAKPDILLGVLDSLTDAIGKIVGGLGCPQLKKIDTKQLQALPGYTKKPVY